MKFNRMLLLFGSMILIVSCTFFAAFASEVPAEETTGAGEPVSEEPVSEEPVISDVKGDPDCDGKVTASDARIALRVTVGLEKLPPEIYALCDYDDNGDVDAADARYILRVSVGLDPFKTQADIKREEFEKQLRAAVMNVSENRITDTLTYLTQQTPNRGIFCNNNEKAESYLTSSLRNIGFTAADIDVHVSDWKGVRCADIVARIPTSTPDPDIYLLCAHYDCAEGVQGAVDNGSGVAVVMEAARVLKSMNKDFGAELRFAFFDGEEKGYIGAYRYLSAISDDEEQRHTFLLNVDMAGASKLQPQKYLVVSTEPVCEAWPWREAYSNFTSRSVDAAKEHLGDLGEDKYYSAVAAGMHDLVPFRKNGMKGATLSWRQYDPSSSHGSDYGLASPYTIHTTGDTLANLDIRSVTNVGKLAVAAVLFALNG